MYSRIRYWDTYANASIIHAHDKECKVNGSIAVGVDRRVIPGLLLVLRVCLMARATRSPVREEGGLFIDRPYDAGVALRLMSLRDRHDHRLGRRPEPKDK
jgi:hypothetical protein